MIKRMIPRWLVVVILPFGLVLLVMLLWVFMSLTASPLYSTPESMPTVMTGAVSPEWSGMVDKSRQVVRTRVAEQNLPGVSVAVGIGDSLIWAEGFGFADIRISEPVTPRHRFRIGTTSSVLTSAAAGLLMENGKLNPDEEIQRYVPQFPQKQWLVSLRQVMGHTAGIIGEDRNTEPLFSRGCDETGNTIQFFANQPLLFQPGTKYQESANDWVLVSAAIEAASGQPFLAFMNEQIFKPLGMQDTFADPGPDQALIDGEDFPGFILIRELIHDPDATRNPEASLQKQSVPGQVQSYSTRFRSDPKYGVHLMRLRYLSCYAGAGVFTSTPSDLVRFGMAIQKGKLLHPATVSLLQSSQKLPSGEETGYGLGWYNRTLTLAGKQTRAIGNDGSFMGGMVTSLLLLPDSGVVIAVMSNTPFADTASISLKIAESFAAQKK